MIVYVTTWVALFAVVCFLYEARDAPGRRQAHVHAHTHTHTHFTLPLSHSSTSTSTSTYASQLRNFLSSSGQSNLREGAKSLLLRYAFLQVNTLKDKLVRWAPGWQSISLTYWEHEFIYKLF